MIRMFMIVSVNRVVGVDYTKSWNENQSKLKNYFVSKLYENRFFIK